MRPSPPPSDRSAVARDPSKAELAELQALVRTVLLPGLRLESADPHHPVVVHELPAPFERLGCGNYAGVFVHPDHPHVVIKVYAPGRPGWADECEVYRRLGAHPAYSRCLAAETPYLLLRRLRGVTLYDAVHRGIPIPPRVIRDVDDALRHARALGLHPHDVHGRNVMLTADGRGLVVDVSDFLDDAPCTKWRDLRLAYRWLYRPLLRPLRVRVPYAVLDGARVTYRRLRRLLPR
jgi:hypothetical protein